MIKPIGIMDSGVGGLTVASEVMHALPSETIYYFADTINCPYGPKDTAAVYIHTKAAVQFLIEQGVKAIIIACNTATAAVMPELQKEVDIPLYGVITPGALGAVRKSKNSEILLLATEGTVKSGEYEKAIFDFDSEVKVHSLACPEFVTLIESGDYKNHKLTQEVIEQSLKAYKETKADTVILGCTHFPLIEREIDKFFDGKKEIVDAGFETVNIALNQMYRQDLLSSEKHQPVHQFFIHGENDTFETILTSWIKDIDYKIKHIWLSEENEYE